VISGRRTAVAAAALFAVTACSPGVLGGGGEEKAGAPSASAGGEAGPALEAVEALEVKGRAPRTGYERDRFGSPWADVDGNSCGTRDDILERDLENVRYRDGDCVVVSGTLADDPYTGQSVEFEKGRSEVDIDHLVALSDAWQKGAGQWKPSKRIALANDLMLAV